MYLSTLIDSVSTILDNEVLVDMLVLKFNNTLVSSFEYLGESIENGR